MKKQCIFIYDFETKKIIHVADVRSLTDDQFEKYDKEAKLNLKSIIDEKERIAKDKESTILKAIHDLDEKVKKLEDKISYILGESEEPTNEEKN